jgi:thiamine biosynthesis lipoprotein
MHQTGRVAVYVVGLWLSGALASPAFAASEFAFHHENVMGTSLELRVIAEDLEVANHAEVRVLGEIDRLTRVFSGYDRNSEFSRWQATSGEPVRVSTELFEQLADCDRWRDRSCGAFDPRVEVFSRLWSSSQRHQRLPTDGALREALTTASLPAWQLDRLSGTATRLSGCPLSLNAIAKGYIIESACSSAMAADRGLQGLLLNVGGDLRVCGEMPLVVGITPPWADSESAKPISIIEVKDRAVATSGNSQRGFKIDGQWYSHILDPRTGRPVDRVHQATVIAPRSADADALATTLNVLSPQESLSLVSSLSDVECLIISGDVKVTKSAGWHHYEKPSSANARPIEFAGTFALERPSDESAKSGSQARPKETATASWNQDHELVVNFEINAPEGEGRRYRRPYVAVWVENKEGFPIRNLTLWVSMGGAGPFQWIPDLKRWYRADLERKKVDKKEMVFTVARPTRPPGKYKVVWDGKDDQGKPVASGEYTVYIDSAREHGTYQSMHKSIILADKPFTEELEGNIEIKSASIEYRRKAPAKAAR